MTIVDARANNPPESTTARERLGDWLNNPLLEVLPNNNSIAALESVPPNVHLSITNLLSEPIETTVDFSRRLIAEGRDVAPHIAAARISREKAPGIVSSVKQSGIEHIFIIGGDRLDRTPTYSSAVELLDELHLRGITFEKIGIVGHPEGHNDVSDADLSHALLKKQAFADEIGAQMYIVTQMCFDAATLLDWVEGIRKDGVDLPVMLGIPGPIELTRLINYSQRCAVGASQRLLESDPTLVTQFPYESFQRFNPLTLLSKIAGMTSDAHGISGVYFFTFNDVVMTHDWINQTRQALGRET